MTDYSSVCLQKRPQKLTNGCEMPVSNDKRSTHVWPQAHCDTNPKQTVVFPYSTSVQFSSVPRPTEPSGGHEGRFSRDPLQAFSAGGHSKQSGHERGCALFDVVHPAFSLPTTASPTFQGALTDEFGGATSGV